MISQKVKNISKSKIVIKKCRQFFSSFYYNSGSASCLRSAYFAQTIIRFPNMFLPKGNNFLTVQFKEDHF